MNILMLSWRDIKNPNKGGAEVYTYEILKRLVKKGYNITWFAASFNNCKKNELIDGINIIRAGSFFTVYKEAYKYYKLNFNEKYDLVIDQINTIPFFTPLYVKEKRFGLIFQLAREVWLSETAFPINILGYLSEPIYLRLYKNQKMITISNSTKSDLNKLGFNNVSIVPVGLSITPVKKVPIKEKNLTIIYVGRLKKSKRVDEIVTSFSIINSINKDSKLWIIGEGDFELKLRGLVDKLSLNDKVKFFGYVNENEKRKLMSKAHFICVTSRREGWGMIVTEANALGTPAVVYDSPGLRDAVKNNFNGIVLKKNCPKFLSDSLLKVWSNKKFYDNLCNNSLVYAKQFDWDKTADLFEDVIENV